MDQVTDPQHECLLLIVALKYALAGDVESAAPLEEIEERIRAIDWKSAAFIHDTEIMRAGMSSPEPRQVNLPRTLMETVHYLTERCAEKDEAILNFRSHIVTAGEQTQASLALAASVAGQSAAVISSMQRVGALFNSMLDDLVERGADVTAYEDAISSIFKGPPTTDFPG